MECVHFVPWEVAAGKAEAAFLAVEERLRTLLPDARVEHIGSTSIPGARTKGDLDVCVRVEPADFARCEEILASAFARNVGSDHSASLASFKDDDADPPLGVQLVAKGGPEDDFVAFRDALRAAPALVAEYDALKARFEGASMDAYREAKAPFVERVLAAIRTTGGERT